MACLLTEPDQVSLETSASLQNSEVLAVTEVRKPQFNAPLYIAWEVTLQCNARCLHCYSESGPGIHNPDELNTEQALKIIDDLADSGLLILAFSGGEPLM